MEWKNRRIDALLEQALTEDKAASDTTTNLTIDADLRATATILARQEMVVAGLGCIPRFFEIFAGSTSASLRRAGSKSSAIRRYSTVSASIPVRRWQSSGIMPALCSVASGSFSI